MIRKILLRLLHIIKSDSNKGFGIHSPFVFDFVVNVLNEKRVLCVQRNRECVVIVEAKKVPETTLSYY